MPATRNPSEASSPTPVLIGFGVLLIIASLTRLWRIGPFHPADIVLIGWCLVWAAQWLGGQCALPRPIGLSLGWAVAALAGLAVAGSGELRPALLDVLKVAALLVIGSLLFANIAYARERALRLAIAGATLATVIVATVQYLLKAEAVNVAGLLDNRTLYGACVAAGTPFVIGEIAGLPAPLRRWRTPMLCGFLLVAAITLLSLPALIVFCLSALIVAHFAKLLRPAVIALAFACGLIAFHVLPRDQAVELAGSVGVFDAGGHVRRHAIEACSSARAIADRPLLGHGPATYQHVAGSAQYRGALPAPAENRVERGTNPGYLVIAVEYGIPAAVCFALMLLAAGGAALAGRTTTGGQATRGTLLMESATVDSMPAVAAGVSALTLAASSIFTVLLINGPGFLLAAVIGLCAAQRQRSRDAARALAGGFASTHSAEFEPGFARIARKDWRAWFARAAGVCACVALGVALRSPRISGPDEAYDNMAASDLSGKGRAVVVLQAADAMAIVPPMHKAERRDAAGGRCLEIDEFAGKPPKVEGSAEYAVEIAQHGCYRVWVRAWWSDGCANSVAAALDNGAPYLMGNDGTYARWHWVRGPVVELKPGKHVLTLYEREDNLKLDQIALSNDDNFSPNGALEHEKTKAPPRVVALAEPFGPGPKPDPAEPDTAPPELVGRASAPVKTNEASVDPKSPVAGTEARTTDPKSPAPPIPPMELPKAGPPFLVGIAGSYRSGFEGHLVSLGIPYVRVREDQVGKIDELKDISVLFTSDSRCGSNAAYEATLLAYLKSGRTAIVEFLPEDFTKRDDTENLFLLPDSNASFAGTTLISDASPFFKGLPAVTPYPSDVTCNCIPLDPGVAGVSIFGGQSRNQSNRKECGALMVRTVGKGKLYFLGVAAGFSSMWRGRKVDPFLVNVLRDACGSSCSMPFADFQYAPKQTAAVNVTDDFMRAPETKGGWKLQSGRFDLTGQIADQNTTFSVHATGASSASIGADNWKDYRVAAAVLLRGGEAGVWQSAADGSRLELRLRDHGRSVAMVRKSGKDEKVLAEAAVPEYGSGWRRLALFRRDGVTQGFVDSEPVLRVKDALEAAGLCGLCTAGDGANAYFDDFAAIDASALTAGRDVAPGEEGSERCMARYYQRCSEKLSIYSPQWMLKPWPTDQNFMQIALPLYSGGELIVDDQTAAPIPAGDDLPTIKLPALPHFDCAIHATGWRDYHFAGRITDWHTSSGDWGQINRWSCSPDYEWYGGRAQQDAVIWHKHAAKGSVAMEVLMAPRADRQYGEEEGHDLNLVIHGNGKDLSEGYLFTVLSAGRGCVVSRNGKVLATAPNAGLEASGHTLHHSWFSVAASVSHGKIRFYFDRRLAIECTDDQPLSAGKLGIWTRQNKISIARATISYGE